MLRHHLHRPLRTSGENFRIVVSLLIAPPSQILEPPAFPGAFQHVDAPMNISVVLPIVDVLNRDLVVKVSDGRKRFGELRISRGSVDWVPCGNYVNGYKMSWLEFVTLIQEHVQETKL